MSGSEPWKTHRRGSDERSRRPAPRGAGAGLGSHPCGGELTYGRRRVGLIVLLLADADGCDEPRGLESRELPLHGARAGPGQRGYLVRLEAPARIPEEHSEDSLLHLGEQDIGQSRSRRLAPLGE